jgi:alginate O-acetyltransferase complex protein AlgJ
VVPYLAVSTTDDAAGGLDLFGDSGPPPLVLVGTSYSANPNWSFVEALKLSLSQDVINYAREGQGPVAPMKILLQKMDRAAPPPVVIWEFPVRYLSDPALLDAVVETEGVGDA